MAVLVDSNVNLDVATKDSHVGRVVYGRAVSRSGHASVLVIEPLVFAEVSVEDSVAIRRRTRQRSWRGGAFSPTAGAEGAA